MRASRAASRSGRGPNCPVAWPRSRGQCLMVSSCLSCLRSGRGCLPSRRRDAGSSTRSPPRARPPRGEPARWRVWSRAGSRARPSSGCRRPPPTPSAAAPRPAGRPRRGSARRWPRLRPARSARTFAASCCTRSRSARAFSESSIARAISFCARSSAASSGRQANFARRATSTRNVRIVQMNRPGSGVTSGLSTTRSFHGRRSARRAYFRARSADRTLPRESRRLRAGTTAGSSRR